MSSLHSIPLFTSVPPKISRLDEHRTEIGMQYQLGCLQSWQQAGCQIYSLNSADEQLPSYLTDIVSRIDIHRDAKAIVGKPLLYLSDIFNEVRKVVRSGPFILTNADIYLQDRTAPQRIVDSLSSRTCLIERRYDSQGIYGSQTATPYFYGYDLFAFNVEDLDKLDAGNFIFGVPWWDHWIPMNAMMSGFRRTSLSQPIGFHLMHAERWDEQLWLQFGTYFLQTLIEKSQSSEVFVEYIKHFADKSKTQCNYIGLLQDLAICNIKEIDGWIK